MFAGIWLLKGSVRGGSGSSYIVTLSLSLSLSCAAQSLLPNWPPAAPLKDQASSVNILTASACFGFRFSLIHFEGCAAPFLKNERTAPMTLRRAELEA